MQNEKEWLLQEKHNGEVTDAYQKDVTLLEEGVPLAYLIGHIPFLNTTIYLDSHPLIPRPETEYWVEKIIETMPSTTTVLDLCAGSGCIGAAVLHARPDAHVDFAEIDTLHHETIRKNGGVHIHGGDLFENISNTYDYILSNPPYIDPEIDRAEESVKNYEPHQALYGGERGMEILSRIIQEALAHLNKNGILVLEHEPEQSKEIAHYVKEYGFSCKTEKDQYGVERYSILERT